VRWWLVCLVGVVAIALVVTMAPVPAAAAPAPEPPPSSGQSPAAWVESTGAGVVRPDLLSASVTARASGQRVEVLSERSATSRTWALPSGGMESEASSAPVRFRDKAAGNDGWRDIDTTLVLNSDGTVAPTAVPNAMQLAGAGDPAGTLVSTTVGQQSLTLGAGVDQPLPAPVLTGSTATYPNVLPDVDVTVEVRPTGFQQLWVAKTRAGLDRLLTEQAGGGQGVAAALELNKLTATLRADAGVVFTDGDSKVVSRLNPPMVWDAATNPSGEPTNQAKAKFDVVDGGAALPPKTGATGKLKLSVVPDQGWLSDPTRKFPVTIDPTYVAGPDQGPIFDTYVKEGDTVDKSGSQYLAIGMGSDGLKHRSFLNFSNDPFRGKTITSASLSLWSDESGTCTPNGWSAYDAGPASTASRWTAQPTVGTKYATSTQTKGAAACADGLVSIDMKAQVQAWASLPAATTTGLAIKSDNETTSTDYHRFWSSDAASNQPVLRWTYNRPPDATTAPTIADTAAFTPAGATSPLPYTANRKPTVSAVLSDPDGDTGTATFQASTTAAFSTVDSTCTSPAVASAATASCALATDLAADGRYYVRARSQDSNGAVSGWSASVELRVAAVAPAAPVVTCPAPYTSGSWQTAAPAADVTCTVTATGTGFSAPSTITFVVDSALEYTRVPIPQSTSTSVAKTTVTVPRTVGGHSIRTYAEGPARLQTGTSHYLGWGTDPLLHRPKPAPRITTTGAVEVKAAGPAQSGTFTPTAKVQWRVSGATGSNGWVDAPAGNGLTVAQSGNQSQVAGLFDTATVVGLTDASAVKVSERVPTLIDIQVGLTRAAGSTQYSGSSTLLRVPHAFGSGYPTAGAGPGQVALWTGELQVDDSDATLTTPGGGLSVSRSHTSFAGIPAVQNQVFGPGWTASFDGDDSGAGGAELYDNTPVDGSLAVLDADGSAIVFATPTGARRTTAAIPTGAYKPADADTQVAGMTLTVSGSGSSTVAELKGDDGIVTKFQVVGTPGAGPVAFRTVEVREPATTDKTNYSYDTAGRVVALTATLPDGVSACAPGTPAKGCRVLKISYATTTTATTTTPGDYVGRVKAITAQVNLDSPDRQMAGYGYDSSGRLVQATDSRSGLTTGYGWTGSGTGLRLASLTPPGEAGYSFGYTANKLKNVTRPNPASAGGGTAQLAAYVYGVPTSGTGLPAMGSATAAWQQAKTPTWGAAVFGPDQPIGDITPAAVTNPEWWKRADLSYTDPDGYTVNTVGWGAGDWQYTAADYDGTGNVIRSFDQRGTRAVLAGGIPAGGASSYATLTTYNADIVNGSGAVVTPAGTLVTDTYSPINQAVSVDGSLQMLRLHTTTSYDQGAPNGGINPATGQPYRLPTSVTTRSEYEDGTVNGTHTGTLTGYSDPLVGDATKTGWDLGQATSSTTDMDLSGNVSAGDITSRTRYDTRGRTLETRQPLSVGGDAGTRATTYYTGSATGPAGCVNKPEWAGLTCKVGPAGQPSGQTMPTTTTTAYTWDLQTATEVDTSGSVTSTTTTSYDSKDRPTTTSTTVAGLASSTPVPAVTTSYDPVTGDVTGTTSTAGSTAITYDSWGRQLTYTNTPAGQPGDGSTTTYNPLGQVVSVVDNNGQTAYTYDGADANGQPETRGLITAVDVKLTGGTEYTSTGAYDHAGDLTLEKLPGKIIRRTGYDTAGNQTGYGYNGQVVSQTTGQFVDDQPWLAWTTIYTPLGQVNRDMTPGGAGYGTALGATASALNRSFGYDRAGRLTFAKERYGNGALISAEPGCSTRTYTFDANGNRTGQNAVPPDANGACVTTGGSPTTRAYDTADRPTTGANGTGTYTYDQLGRQTVIPAADAPKPADGDIALGYYDTDNTRTITQNGATTSYTLDGANRRLNQTETTGGTTNTLVRHYTDSGDNPTWSVDITGTTTTTTRYNELINGDLGLTFDTAGSTTAAQLALDTPRGDTATTITLPTGATNPTGTAATGIDTWTDYTEYGIPRQPPATTPGGVTGIGYGWLGAEERATLDTGLTLMGARMYNPTTGTFTSLDPIYGGNDTTFSYPNDPVNKSDITGEAFWIPVILACIRYCYRAYRAGRAIYRGYKAYRTVRRVRPYRNSGKGCNSFLPATRVLMADGTTKPIDEVELGDLVLATDPKTGESAAEEVTDLILGSGLKDLIQVGTDPDGDGITDWITATDGHPFWVLARGWTDAGDLTLGDQMVNENGKLIKITSLSESVRTAVVHNLTVDRIHTYYVMAGKQSVLVHNAGSCPKHGHGPQAQSNGKSSGRDKHPKADKRRAADQKRSNNRNTRPKICNDAGPQCRR
jgi:RHS repeat-associated protein